MITQTEIADKLGIHQATVSKAFSGRCGKKTAQKLAEATKRPWHEYLAMTGPEIEADIRAALESQAA